MKRAPYLSILLVSAAPGRARRRGAGRGERERRLADVATPRPRGRCTRPADIRHAGRRDRPHRRQRVRGPADAADPRRSTAPPTAGSTWAGGSRIEVYGQLAGVGFSDAEHAWAVGGDYSQRQPGRAAAASADAGKTWTRQTIDRDVGAPAGAVPDRRGGLRHRGRRRRVLAPSTAASTGRRTVAGAADVSFTGLSFVDATHGWVCGPQGNEDFYGGRCYVTGDGGVTWKDVSPGQGHGRHRLQLRERQRGLGRQPRTHDLPHHRRRRHLEQGSRPTMVPGVSLVRLDFVDAQNGWADRAPSSPADGGTTAGAVVLHTTDGGESWVQQDSGVGELGREVWLRRTRSTPGSPTSSASCCAPRRGRRRASRRPARRGPTALNAVSVRRGGKATFRFRVTDPGVPRAQVKIQILDAKKRVKSTLAVGWRTTGPDDLVDRQGVAARRQVHVAGGVPGLHRRRAGERLDQAAGREVKRAGPGARSRVRGGACGRRTTTGGGAARPRRPSSLQAAA